MHIQITCVWALLWALAIGSLNAKQAWAAGDGEFAVPPKSGAIAASTSARPKLGRHAAVKDFKLDPNVKQAIEASLQKYAIDTREISFRAAEALQAARREKDPRAAQLLYEAALQPCNEALSRTQENEIRIAIAYLHTELRDGDRQLARSYLLQVLNDENATNVDLVNAAAQLRELALAPTFNLEIGPDDISANARGVAKILSSNTLGSLDLGSVQRPLAAAKLFQSAGDSVWAAQMYRECLRVDPRHAESKAALTNMKLREAPLFPKVVGVTSHYTIQKDELDEYSFKYLEEEVPQVDLWAGIMRYVLDNYYAGAKGWKRVEDSDIERFKTTYTNRLGADYKDFRGLFLQSYTYVLMRTAGLDYATTADFCKRNSFQKLTQRVTSIEIPPVSDDMGGGLQFVQAIKSLSVDYLQTDQERLPYLLSIQQGVVKQLDAPFDTTQMSTAFSGKGSAIYVLSPDGSLYAGIHKVSRFHHSSFLAAADVAGAGELKVVRGRITEISNKSGHYRPGVTQLVQTLEYLKSKQVDLSGIAQLKIAGRSRTTGGTLLKSWDGNANDFLNLWRDNESEFQRQLRGLFR